MDCGDTARRGRVDVFQTGSERDHETSRVTRKVKDMRRVVFWRSKAFGATGPAHRGKVPDTSVAEQLLHTQSDGGANPSLENRKVWSGRELKMPNALVLRDNEATGKLPRLPGVGGKSFVRPASPNWRKTQTEMEPPSSSR